MDRQQDSSLLNAPFVSFGLVLGNSHANQRSCDPAHRPADTDARQSGHHGPGGDERTKPRNRQGPDSGQPPQGPSQHGTRGRAGRYAFRRLGCLLMSKVL